MKKLKDLVTIINNDMENVTLEMKENVSRDLIIIGFNGDETMIRYTKGDDHTITIWKNDGKYYSWHYGCNGTTLISNQLKIMQKKIESCIIDDFDIIVEGADIYKTLGTDRGLETHTYKVMYWTTDRGEIVVHKDGIFYRMFANINEFNKNFADFKIEFIGQKRARTGCYVDYYKVSPITK